VGRSDAICRRRVSRRDFVFYGKNYGWAVRFRSRGKALLSIYPWHEGFTAQIILSQEQAEKAMGLDLGKNARKVLSKARQFPEGRWLFIRVESEKDIRDVKRLLMIKSEPDLGSG